MAGKPDNGLRSLSTFLSGSPHTWWEKFLFARRFQKRLAHQLVRIIEIGSHRNFTAYELARDMGIDDMDGQCAVDEALRYLLLKGKIEQPYPGKFCMRDYCRVTGVMDLSVPDCPALISGAAKRTVYIAPDGLHGASHGDTVMVKLRQGGSHSLEAEVLRVIKYAQRRMVGNLEVLEHRAYFTPLNRELFRDIEIPLSRIKDAENGDRVIVELGSYSSRKDHLTGKVVKVVGENGTEYVESLSRLQEHGFAIGFSDEEEDAAAALRPAITEADIAKRLDLRGVCTFTIDPDGTKDIDDALSIRALDNGNWEVGIHIADVTHYIKAGSTLDKHAYHRATSVYLADRVLPLFPDAIAQLCSLAPDEDHLAFSVIVELTGEAKTVRCQLAKTIIRSQRQYSYNQAQWALDGLPDTFAEELKIVYALSQKLRAARFANGAITFTDRPDYRFEFDDVGMTKNVTLRKRTETMKLIEEFMLLANRSVAEKMTRKRLPFIYRAHGLPNITMFDELRRVAANYGYSIHADTNRGIAKAISTFLKQLEGKKEATLSTSLCIRAMARGKYSPLPRRHFALSFDAYTHFTSPIRRYADIVVHRLLAKAFIDHTEHTGIIHYAEACTHFNFMRERAKSLEDRSDQQKCAEYLAAKTGEEMEGTITHVTPTMMAVELDESGIRGRVLLQTLIDDQYRLNFNTYVITGAKTNNHYRIGNRVCIRVAHVSASRGVIDFTLISKIISKHAMKKRT